MTNEEIIKKIKSYEEYYQSGIDDDSSFAFLIIDEVSALDMDGYSILRYLQQARLKIVF